jgi:phytoene synthase
MPIAVERVMNPHAYCQERAASSGSSFYYSFLFLPQPRRRAIIALYAFCREVDDAVDETSDPSVARMKLAWWRTEIAAIYHGRPQHPVALALVDCVGPFRIAREQLEEIVEGMQMDLERNRYESFDALRLYCHRVAGVVGLLSAEIFGYTDRSTLEYAHTLGIAFQLTNIIRDVGEDARRGRIYLPRDDLARYAVTESDIMAGRESDHFRALMMFQIARARSFYSQAMEKLPRADRSTQRAGLIMAGIYQRVLDEIEAAGCPVLSSRVSLTPLRKLWIAWRTWVAN